jgi:hypothetical protein
MFPTLNENAAFMFPTLNENAAFMFPTLNENAAQFAEPGYLFLR